MPVAVNFGDDVALHEDAERWRYSTVDGGMTIIELYNEDDELVTTELIAQNVCQIQRISTEEYYEALEMV